MNNKVANSVLAVCFFSSALLLWPALVGCSSAPLPSSSGAPKITKKMVERERAKKLFESAQRENPKLSWDDCLAGAAAKRAKKMAKQGYFDHKDPRTNRNPAWRMVSSCHKCQYAGENLTKGNEPAEDIHRALMESPSHRENIQNQRFDLLGVGCYDNICVELFAGF